MSENVPEHQTNKEHTAEYAFKAGVLALVLSVAAVSLISRWKDENRKSHLTRYIAVRHTFHNFVTALNSDRHWKKLIAENPSKTLRAAEKLTTGRLTWDEATKPSGIFPAAPQNVRVEGGFVELQIIFECLKIIADGRLMAEAAKFSEYQERKLFSWYWMIEKTMDENRASRGFFTLRRGFDLTTGSSANSAENWSIDHSMLLDDLTISDLAKISTYDLPQVGDDFGNTAETQSINLEFSTISGDLKLVSRSCVAGIFISLFFIYSCMKNWTSTRSTLSDFLLFRLFGHGLLTKGIFLLLMVFPAFVSGWLAFTSSDRWISVAACLVAIATGAILITSVREKFLHFSPQFFRYFKAQGISRSVNVLFGGVRSSFLKLRRKLSMREK